MRILGISPESSVTVASPGTGSLEFKAFVVCFICKNIKGLQIQPTSPSWYSFWNYLLTQELSPGQLKFILASNPSALSS